MPMSRIPGGVGVYVAVLLNIALVIWGYGSFRVRDDFWHLMTNLMILNLNCPEKRSPANGDEISGENLTLP